ncbi:MAG: prolipoprotein diacylglyceryl transferase [Lewinella sp.]|jgi:prolipoprotein diacylglyceryl transferase|uniref:prolipoprotein diacylglyceryl transferase n=1 Tax=Lewinella TaxID=70994 RepID=UPI00038227CC|nr:prolipoprotein diacylglyceryl transferase [Lewinella cohaerens]
MQFFLLAIEWSISPEIAELGPLSLRWYGLLFALGFLLGLFIVRRMFLAEKAPEEWLDKCFMYMVIGTVIGARLGHVFFYDWDYYSQHLGEIHQIWKGGLASHGGAMGIVIALWIFSRRISKKPLLWILDKVAVPTALAGCFIRLGNLMNSEILGKPSDGDLAFVFTRVDDVPRHPAQLYESITYLIAFVILYYVYWNTDKRKKPGYILGLFFVLVFGSRFYIENFKASQGGFETVFGNALSTGQLLSIPFVLVGLFLMFRPEGQKVGKRA